MRIRVRHQTTYTYDRPVQSIIQVLRMTPRSHEGQFVRRWQIDVDRDVLLRAGEDAFGNITHVLSLSGPVDNLIITLDGEVETRDTGGIVLATLERFPVQLFLRDTDLTARDHALAAFAKDTAVFAKGPVDALHALLVAINNVIAFDPAPTSSATTAVEAFRLRRGVCQDMAHVFIACARRLGVPARYVSGHLLRDDGATVQEAGHAWAEAYVPDLGWVGFDPANGVCVTDAYVRVAVGLDYLGAAPVRGSRSGEATEGLAVKVTVEPGGQQ